MIYGRHRITSILYLSTVPFTERIKKSIPTLRITRRDGQDLLSWEVVKLNLMSDKRTTIVFKLFTFLKVMVSIYKYFISIKAQYGVPIVSDWPEDVLEDLI